MCIRDSARIQLPKPDKPTAKVLDCVRTARSVAVGVCTPGSLVRWTAFHGPVIRFSGRSFGSYICLAIQAEPRRSLLG
ncbi:hypothetical protein DFAR_3850023 [Desulfarculales bacterium]